MGTQVMTLYYIRIFCMLGVWYQINGRSITVDDFFDDLEPYLPMPFINVPDYQGTLFRQKRSYEAIPDFHELLQALKTASANQETQLSKKPIENIIRKVYTLF